MLLPWLVAVLVGVTAAFLLKPIYVSRVTLMLEQPQELAGPLGGMVGGGISPEQQAGRMREQVQSTVFLRSVITAAGMRDAPGVRAWALRAARRFAISSSDTCTWISCLWASIVILSPSCTSTSATVPLVPKFRFI